jgi:hypothetical protein
MVTGEQEATTMAATITVQQFKDAIKNNPDDHCTADGRVRWTGVDWQGVVSDLGLQGSDANSFDDFGRDSYPNSWEFKHEVAAINDREVEADEAQAEAVREAALKAAQLANRTPWSRNWLG